MLASSRTLWLWIYWLVVVWFEVNIAEGSIGLLGGSTLAFCVGIKLFWSPEAIGYEPRNLIDRKPQGVRKIPRRDLERGDTSRRRLS